LHDGITFEQSGKRAVVLCTEPFEVTVRNIARGMGLPDYPCVFLPHPLGSLSDEQIDVLADTAIQEAVAILMDR
jgi:hypothetical protein